MALSDVSLRCKAMSGLGATADIGRRYGLDGSVAFDPQETLRRRWADRVDFRAWSSSPFDREDTPFAGDTFEGLAAAVAKAQPRAGD